MQLEINSKLKSMKSTKESTEVSCETCTFFGKPFLCVRKENNPKAVPCLSYNRKILLQDEAMYPLLPDVGLGKLKEESVEVSGPSILWYLVPFFFSIIGGLIGYVAVKDQDKDMATGLLAFGIFMFFVDLLVAWLYYNWLLSLIGI